jgi:hypothetical protein
MKRACVFLLAIVFFWTGKADAQTTARVGEVFLSINGGYQSGSDSVTGAQAFALYDEAGQVTTGYRRAPRGLADLSAGIRVWRGLSFGAGVSWTASNQASEIVATVPHPLFFDQARTARLTTSLKHSEVGVHVQASWALPLTEDIEMAVSVGPSVFRIKQDIVTGVQVAEVGAPFDQVRVVSATTETQSKTAAGVNVGLDFIYMLTPRLGGGLLIRYVSVSADMGDPGAPVSIEAGGVQAALGLRLRF